MEASRRLPADRPALPSVLSLPLPVRVSYVRLTPFSPTPLPCAKKQEYTPASIAATAYFPLFPTYSLHPLLHGHPSPLPPFAVALRKPSLPIFSAPTTLLSSATPLFRAPHRPFLLVPWSVARSLGSVVPSRFPL